MVGADVAVVATEGYLAPPSAAHDDLSQLLYSMPAISTIYKAADAGAPTFEYIEYVGNM